MDKSCERYARVVTRNLFELRDTLGINKKLVLCVTLIFLTSNSYSQNEWMGKNKDINNISVILNPDQPIYVNSKMTLEKEWEIGGEDPGFIFNNIIASDVDENGSVYVLDILEDDIKVFSKEGTHLFTFGQKGQGPGEFLRPHCLVLLPDNRILIIDIGSGTSKFNIFNYKGNYIDTFLTTFIGNVNLGEEDRIYFCKYFSNGRIILYTQCREEMKYTVQSLWLLHLNKQKAERIFKTCKVDPRYIGQTKQNDRQYLNIQWCHDKSGNLYIIKDRYNYEIEVYNLNRKLLRKVKREFQFPPKTKEEYREGLESGKKFDDLYRKSGLNFTWETLKYKPIICSSYYATRSMFCDDKNRLWVLTNDPYPPKKSKGILGWVKGLFNNRDFNDKIKHSRFTFDIFNSDGKFLMKVFFDAIKPKCFVYKDGYLYFTALKKDGYPWLFKYKIMENIYD